MTSNSDALARGLHAAVDGPIPDDHVDLGQLLSEGRRLVRRRARRRVAGAVTGLAAVCLAAAFLPSDRPTTTVPATPSQSPTATATTPATGSDPLLQSAAFGWLPPQDTSVFYEHNPLERQHPYGENDSASSATFDYEVDLFTDEEPGVSLEGHIGSMTRIGPINGHEAYESTRTGDMGLTKVYVEVILQSPSGQWISLETNNLSEQVAVRIARSLVFAPVQRPLPIRLSGPLAASSASAAAQLMLGQGSLRQALVNVAVSKGVIAQIAVTPGGGATQSGPVTASENVNGLHISLTLNKNGDQGSSFADVPAGSEAKPLGSATAYLAYITSLGSDPADWSTGVFTTR